MLDPKQIEEWLVSGLACKHVAVEGDGRHFQALIVSGEFSGLNRVQRQQRVNAVLERHFESGLLHALSMRTLTPEEWQTVG